MYYDRRTENGFVLGAERVQTADHDSLTDHDTPSRYYYLPRTVDFLTRTVMSVSAVGLVLIGLSIVLVLTASSEAEIYSLLMFGSLVASPPFSILGSKANQKRSWLRHMAWGIFTAESRFLPSSV